MPAGISNRNIRLRRREVMRCKEKSFPGEQIKPDIIMKGNEKCTAKLRFAAAA